MNKLKNIEIGREAPQASTDVRAGHRGQPAKLTKLALTNLKFLEYVPSIGRAAWQLDRAGP